ncbi:checkpoint protein hus1 [Microdochium trichocladiopsis]|uniref:Checkpoint protein n=1 Tax=Microdochium trichocladiopsis TaxID=1682393 RepID=A0A9P8YA02_9PEZI|nr:checkpoint protein hus1 [Microdochium trichocladiopsis]KAH7033426.1 checkpoint protein hus1 [Microdochium trichocladiopsis]
MRFRTNLKNIRTFSKLVAALAALEKIAWVRLDDDNVRFTVIPDTGSQVWASLGIDLIFDSLTLQSNEPNNTINLELPLVPLQRALRSALNGDSATLRLTKKDGVPILSMTITTSTRPSNPNGYGSGFSRFGGGGAAPSGYANNYSGDDNDGIFAAEPLETSLHRDREKIITQDIPVRVLHPETVETIMQPKVREPDVHIQLPPLLQLKAISDRFTKLALAAAESGSGGRGGNANSNPKLEISANMHGDLRLRLDTDTLQVESAWHGLENPEVDPAQLSCAIEDHPSTRFREAGPDKWATVRVDGKDWSKVLSVGRLDGRVIACFADDHALILYVFVAQYDDGGGGDDSVLTYYVSSYSL